MFGRHPHVILGARLTRVVVFGCLAFAIASCQRSPFNGCNVVLIIIDTLRADALGAYGNAPDASPELDRMAERGVLFERVVANSSWTRPSIASMLTSLHARSLGIYDERGDQLAERFTVLSEILNDAGYTTIGVTANPNINSAFGFSQGFDHYLDSNKKWSWMDDGERDLTKEKRIDPARIVFKKALEFIGEDAKPPYYLQLTLMEMHTPGPPIRPEFLIQSTPPVPQRMRKYAAALRQVSHEINQFFREITALRGMDDTLFILVSDHGEGLNDHPGIRGGKYHGDVLYESNVLVPLIILDSKGRLKERRIKQAVQLLDLAPTILDLVGVEIPASMLGVSLKSLVTAEREGLHLPEFIVTETEFRDNEKIAVYSEDWKYIENREQSPGNDERELQARGGKELGGRSSQLERHPEVAEQLDVYLAGWERVHRKIEATRPAEGMSEETLEQLRAVGYLE